jgi:putative ABC transport system permease protein
VAVVLAATGLYGLLSFNVARRIHEIGLRMALGARAGNVRGMVVKEGLGLAALGVLMGLAAASAAARLIEGLLFQVHAFDPATLLGVSVLLMLVAWLASYLPARRATRVDPMLALRCE